MPSVAELLLRRGEILANQKLASADRQAALAQQLGGIATGAIEQYQTQKAQAPILAQQQRVRDLQEQQLQGQVAGQQREQQEADALNALFATTPNPKPEQIYAIVGPEKGQKIVTGLQALADAGTKRYESRQKVVADTLAGMDALPEPVRATAYPGVRQHLIQSGIIAPEDAPEGYDPAWFQQARGYGQATQKPDAKVVGGALVSPTGEVIYQAPEKPEKVTFAAPQAMMIDGKRTMVRSGSDGQLYDMNGQPIQAQKVDIYEKPDAPKDERLVQIMGPEGTPIWVRESEAVGKPAAQAARAVTGAERQALAFYNRAKDAVETLTAGDAESLENRMAKQGLLGQLQGEKAPNVFQTEEQQQYRQAQRAFTEARLRKESGAAIPESEFKNDARTYFVQPGDSAEVVKQKQQARAKVLEGLAYSAGKAYDEFYGESFRGAKPSASVPADVSAVLKDAKDGKYTLSDGSVWVKQGGTISKAGG